MTPSIDNLLFAVSAFSGAAIGLVLMASWRSASAWLGLAATAPLAPGLRVGPYQLVEKIGEGAMGQVYRARHVASGRSCAVKLLGERARLQDRARFEDEARFGAALRHENTVHVYERTRARTTRWSCSTVSRCNSWWSARGRSLPRAC